MRQPMSALAPNIFALFESQFLCAYYTQRAKIAVSRALHKMFEVKSGVLPSLHKVVTVKLKYVNEEKRIKQRCQQSFFV